MTKGEINIKYGVIGPKAQKALGMVHISTSGRKSLCGKKIDRLICKDAPFKTRDICLTCRHGISKQLGGSYPARS
jgi:hypothetical protein